LPRRAAIEAAIVAHNRADREPLLPAATTRLLAVMFPQASVCQRSFDDLATEGFDKRDLSKLLRALVEAGFLSKDRTPGRGGLNAYTLHLPPVPQ
jgi:hypothetical protein